ncbi:hypothetical protein APS56_08925 [Pseudalgibacter alginicilyticus]|uniref:Uncharacterized protein n=1 Tax=Pseudalgibacter alginicilyticus TaxID=1736674 RepID=A0A0P0CGK6_9FLAO|nr:hypothetical protein [Pseudalgibacter alginicilyticus]ALJ05239.1 hypothetical protein APS56_08925 [Pseudalgibacter alginicilyticus]
MKRSINAILCFLLLLGCDDKNNILDDIAIRGGYINFVEEPTLTLNILKLDTATISEELVDYNNNALEYSLTLMYEDQIVDDFVVLTAPFPTTLEISVNDFLTALSLTEDDVSLSTNFRLVATVTTPNGEYSGLSPDFNSNNVNEGGETTDRVKEAGFLAALDFTVSFFQPPAKTIRKTSFEEVPVGASTDAYDKPGSTTLSEDLTNYDYPPFVDYTAVGTSATNELGFDSEYIFLPDIATTYIGFALERIGVYDVTDVNGGYSDGNQGYLVEDSDGTIVITFDTVDVPEGQTKSGVSFDAFFRSTSWETYDGIYAYVNITTDTGSYVEVFADVFNTDVDAIEGRWVTFNTGYLNNVRSYELVIEITSSDDTEDIYIDNVIIYEPED